MTAFLATAPPLPVHANAVICTSRRICFWRRRNHRSRAYCILACTTGHSLPNDIIELSRSSFFEDKDQRTGLSSRSARHSSMNHVRSLGVVARLARGGCRCILRDGWNINVNCYRVSID
eukprot:5656821-Pleurochrysis_carterae.AAC.1